MQIRGAQVATFFFKMTHEVGISQDCTGNNETVPKQHLENSEDIIKMDLKASPLEVGKRKM